MLTGYYPCFSQAWKLQNTHSVAQVIRATHSESYQKMDEAQPVDCMITVFFESTATKYG